VYRRDLWDIVRDHVVPVDDDENPILGASDLAFNLILLNPWIHVLFDSAIIGLKPLNIPRRQDPENLSVEFLTVEWRYIPKRVSKAFKSKEGAQFLKEKPATGRPAAVCKINLDSDDLAGFFDRHMRASRHDDIENSQSRVNMQSGHQIQSGMRFELPVYKEDAEKTFRLLELSWLALRISSLSGAAEAIDYLGDRPDDDWERALKAIQQQERDRCETIMRTGRQAEAARAQKEGLAEDESSP
jgi:hypothetical protein